jgi:uncharacterized repeat protein (TIGR03837 family)
MLWDIFCKVIDNHGDIGVCWRLAAQLAQGGQRVRLWVDDSSALQWMAPNGAEGVEVRPWDAQSLGVVPGEVVIEAFGCELSTAFQASVAARTRQEGIQPAWINLEYLTAESFAQRSHGLPSPVFSGPATGLCKHFFYPGFTPGTGGLLREPDLQDRQAAFDPAAWLNAQGVVVDEAVRVSLFCYEPAALGDLLLSLAAGPASSRLLVTAGRATEATRRAIATNDRQQPGWNAAGRLSISWLPLLSQHDFDHLLWSCDLNLVRGEDSLVRALWAGKPFAWHIYPQDDGAHHAKLTAFLEWLQAPDSLRVFNLAWNGLSPSLPAPEWDAWRDCVTKARSALLNQEDLACQLIRFATNGKKR